MRAMSDLGGEGADFFGRIPLFREFARLMATGSGPVNWELARQVAVATAAGADAFGGPPQLPGPAAAGPSPAEARAWDDRLRLAELWVDPVTSLPGPGVTVGARPLSRPDWAEAVLPGFAPLVEPGARRMAEALGPVAGGVPDAGDVLGRVGGLLTGLQAGTLVGQLARGVLTQAELAMPPVERGRVLVLPENVQAFEDTITLPGDQLHLWLACHAVVGQRLFAGVAWLRDHLHGLVGEIARETEPDASGLLDRIQSLDVARPEALQELLEGGEGLLGPPSAALQAAIGRLEVLLALVAGYQVVICGRALYGRLPSLEAIEAAVAQRLAGEDSPQRLFAALLRADPDRAAAGRGDAFCREVLAATDIAGLDRLWAHPDFLPTPEELGVPGRWLERVGLVGGEEVDLDEGLRALLEGEGGDKGEPPAGGQPG
jgi:putative hydrolase